MYPVVHLKIVRNVEYPLVWRRMLEELPSVAPGDIVDVVDRQGNFAGRGFFCPTSQIAVRVLSFDPEEAVDAAFFERKLGAAFAFRHETLGLGKGKAPGYRLVNAEGDGLPGLMLDRYGGLIVAEILSIGFFTRLDLLRAVVEKHFPGCAFEALADGDVQAKEGFELAAPSAGTVTVEEHGLRFQVSTRAGHKTGFFLDQRENRLRLRDFAAGREVLDVCCFSGGFALNAAAAGARAVTGIDLDEKAVALAAANAARNGLRAQFIHVDAFPYLRDMQRNGKRVGLLILDPSKLAHSRDDLEEALRMQFDLHRTALEVVEPRGVLVTACCSGLISEEAFLDTLTRAGRRVHREVRVFALSGPSADHPYSLHFPEGRYLKTVWAVVE
jgi:23S rRNA (cytosine1962-C5)-methyltransferase